MFCKGLLQQEHRKGIQKWYQFWIQKRSKKRSHSARCKKHLLWEAKTVRIEYKVFFC